MGITNSELFIGQSARLQRIFTEEDLQQCMELTKDFNPIYQHHDIGLENGYSQVNYSCAIGGGVNHTSDYR